MQRYYLITLLFYTTYLTAQCDVSVNGPYSYCDGGEWYVWMNVYTDVATDPNRPDSVYTIPAFDYTGVYGYADTIRVGPIPEPGNFTFTVVDLTDTSCVSSVTASPPDCFVDQCSLRSLSVRFGPAPEGSENCSEVVIKYVGRPVSITLLDEMGSEFAVVQVTTQDSVSFFNLPAGEYQVEAIDAQGCLEIVRFTADRSVDIPVEIAITGNYCAGDSLVGTVMVQLEDVTGFRYAWSTGDTTAALTLDTLTTDRYYVTVTSPNGCSVVQEFFPWLELIDPDTGFPDASFIDPDLPDTSFINCGNDFIVLAVDGTLLESGNTFAWIGPIDQISTRPEISISESGCYLLFGQAARGCTFLDTAYVFNQNLPGDIRLASFGTDTLCSGEECFGILGLEGIDPTTYEISWEGPPEFTFVDDTLRFATICTPYAGTYRATVTGACDTLMFTYYVAPLSCSELSGRLWLDDAGNCARDAEDIPVLGFLLRLTNEDTEARYYTATDPEGAWAVSLPEGTYRIEPVIREGQPFNDCPDPARAVLAGLPVTGVDVFLPVLTGCPQLRTSVAVPFFGVASSVKLT
ncbi:MAG: carboxypeptidase-like regulatory domain-containing protein [Bacteroidota bacterium]